MTLAHTPGLMSIIKQGTAKNGLMGLKLHNSAFQI